MTHSRGQISLYPEETSSSKKKNPQWETAVDALALLHCRMVIYIGWQRDLTYFRIGFHTAESTQSDEYFLSYIFFV